MSAQSQRPQAVIYDDTKLPDAPMAAVQYVQQVAEVKGQPYADVLQAFAYLCWVTVKNVPDEFEEMVSDHMGTVSNALGMMAEEVGQLMQLVEDHSEPSLADIILGKSH